MKILSIALAALFFGAVMLFSQQTAIMQIVSGTPTLLVSESTLKTAFEQEWNDGTTITSVEIIFLDAKYYVAAKGTNDSTCRSMAILLEQRVDTKWQVTDHETSQMMMKNTCAGVGCSQCSFTTGSTDGVACRCDAKETSNGYCNHSVSDELNIVRHIGNFY